MVPSLDIRLRHRATARYSYRVNSSVQFVLILRSEHPGRQSSANPSHFSFSHNWEGIEDHELEQIRRCA